jgi:hypothetical protein
VALASRLVAWAKAHRLRATLAGAALLAVVFYPFAVGGLAAHLVATKLSERLGQPVTVGRGRGGFGAVVLHDLEVAGADGQPPLVSVKEIRVPFGIALGMRGPVTIEGLRIFAVHGGDNDNLSGILERLRGRKSKGSSGAEGAAAPSSGSGTSNAGARLPAIVIQGGSLEAREDERDAKVTIAAFDAELQPGNRLAAWLHGVRGGLALGGGGGPSFGADEIDVQWPLEGTHPVGYPWVRVTAGRASPLPSLALTGIEGVVSPPPVTGGKGSEREELVIDFRGSYGGAKEALWIAKGRAQPRELTGKLTIRAEQFNLGRIADVLPHSVLAPENTTLDVAMTFGWAGTTVKFAGETAMVGLSMQSDSLALEPIENVSVGAAWRGSADVLNRRIDIERAEARVRDVTARVSGHVAFPPGKFRFKNGKQLDVVPDIDLTLTVPKVSCAKLLGSIPGPLIPRLAGFVLQGTFGADVGIKVDFAHLEALDLRGKIAIDGCKVVKAPPEVTALADTRSLVINVEVPRPPGAPSPPGAEPDLMSVVVGPENPDFVPYEEISPYLVGSIMTTEDNGFFKHHGWVSSQFKSALRRNLERGGFRLGASSITMQMVKNVLLTKDKTLSRKAQELFLVWYLEQILPKERILELYFNAIEFGPRIYGITAAARHYFGKKPSELNPLEAAFFSSILPSPKRRYVQYCHGSLSAQWDRYVRRIMAKAHERGRLTDEEYQAWASEPFKFDRSEATFTERQCLDWVKSMAPPRPEVETPPELDEDGDAGGAVADRMPKRTKRLFSHAAPRQ